MAFFENGFYFIASTVLIVLVWVGFLWLNNRVCRISCPVLQEIVGGVLYFGLFVAVGIILYFLALPLAMGTITVAVALALWYIVRKSLPSAAS